MVQREARLLVLVLCGIASTSGTFGADKPDSTAAKESIPQEFQGLPLVFHDDFESGADRWTPTDPAAWKVIEENGNHVYSLCADSKYEPAVRSPKCIAWINDLTASDFVLEVRMKQTGREYGHRDLCLFFGRTDPTHFYYAHIASKADAHAHTIHLVNGAPRVSIAKERTDGMHWDDQYHRARVVRNTETGLIQVFVDDMTKPVMTAEDKTFPSGGIGIGSFDDTGNFDDVCIWGKKK